SITDTTPTAEAHITLDASIHHLNTKNTRGTILYFFRLRMIQNWTGLRLQGRLACLPCADHSVSHSALRNTALHDDIHKFIIKARLQVLATKANLETCFPAKHEPFCLLHHDQQRESIAHILNGCPAYKGLYIANTNFRTIHTNERERERKIERERERESERRGRQKDRQNKRLIENETP